ncbi:N-acetylmuramic acid 6-phosphate etherase [Candidatus Mycobacterium wuenschmannii]|uniref:N-acetylmuramic acid 6-phosphate etherase n=1 Tax=Candidatus Mycobacterium wuenschmannii TaxID=3027808 RepID=A0ABY8VV26_9MYCO|nr:N-acetylmuramic acid 6-phosphate etherase [Candidatus Mycobacterium wuenschmannii]WIM87463.1 N-acetylmuramic acid 6-phosphate etherase [Candidatus Mycobacterium wuenschmannii]
MILAVDLGKTTCRAAANGRRAEGAGAPGLATPGGVRGAEAAIVAVTRDLGPFDEVVVGVAGAFAAPDAASALGQALLTSLRVEQVTVTSDAVTAHAGALNGEPGAVLVVGTGVAAVAIDAHGTLRTADGWGPWLGDEGGGAWIGAEGLRAALRSHDGRGPSTTLLDAAQARFGAPQTWPAQFNDAAAIASFAPDVLAAQDDPVALEIVDAAVDALAATARALGGGPVALVGGLADALRGKLNAVPTVGDALDGALQLGKIHEPHVIRTSAKPVAVHSLDTLATEGVRHDLHDLDARPIADIVELLVAAEGEAHQAIAAEVPRIAAAAEAITARLQNGGRLIYAGAGTPGRLGVLDAAECGPTFGTDLVRAVIAGGPTALTEAIEGAEDAFGPTDLADLTPKDALVGITASGRTPYVLGALEHARKLGALTVSIVNNAHSEAHADHVIELLTGAEVLAGSTRLTAGTAQKIVLNAISTSVMIALGKAYGPRMVDVRLTNAKVRRRAVRIVRDAANVDEDRAATALTEAGGHAKTAIVALLAGIDAAEAKSRLDRAHGHVRDALGER